MGYSENSEYAVAKYNDIRDILRDVYVYGCFPKEILVEKENIGSRKYDKEKKRIKEFLPADFIRDERVKGHAITKCRYNFEEDPENKLEWTYRNKSFTSYEVVVFFYASGLLYKESTHCLTRSKLLERVIDAVNGFNPDAVFNITPNAFIKIMDTFVEYGLFGQKSDKREVVYYLPKDYWEDFSDEELRDIYLFASFMADSTALKTPYYFLKDKLDLYISSKGKTPIDDRFKISCLHNHLFSVLDDEISYALLTAISSKQPVKIKKSEMKQSVDIVPIKLVWNATYGRQYVFYQNISDQSCKFIRIDEIIAVEKYEGNYSLSQSDYDAMAAKIDDCWCADYHGGKKEEVIIDFRIKEDESYVLRRLKREIDLEYELIENPECEYNYRLVLNVASPKEMIPWIRSFGERAKVVKLGNQEDFFKKSLQDMLKNYE